MFEIIGKWTLGFLVLGEEGRVELKNHRFVISKSALRFHRKVKSVFVGFTVVKFFVSPNNLKSQFER